ncbi:MAG: hypothetical protein IIC82_09310, partial [Chloroflexi bacterium]|nr:hypothetical protein [Chloroflexota bacterium]
VEMIDQRTESGLILFEYALRAVGKDPFLFNNHQAQLREAHQRIKKAPDGKWLHTSGVTVLPNDVENFLETNHQAYQWVDKDAAGNWRDHRGRTLAPYVFPAAPWTGGGDEELDPQWEREQFTLPLQGQIDAAIERYSNRAKENNWTGDMRGTTFSGQVGASADDSWGRTVIGSSLRTGLVSFRPITDAFISFGTSAFDAGQPRGFFARITNVTIANGATINTATASVWGRNAETTAVESVIEAVDADDPAAPTDEASWNAQAYTTASVTWDFSTTFTDNVEFPTPSIVSVIDELITRAGWASGQAMIIYIFDDLDTDTDRRRSAYSYDGNSAQGLALDVDHGAAEATRRYSLTTLGVG